MSALRSVTEINDILNRLQNIGRTSKTKIENSEMLVSKSYFYIRNSKQAFDLQNLVHIFILIYLKF